MTQPPDTRQLTLCEEKPFIPCDVPEGHAGTRRTHVKGTDHPNAGTAFPRAGQAHRRRQRRRRDAGMASGRVVHFACAHVHVHVHAVRMHASHVDLCVCGGGRERERATERNTTTAARGRCVERTHITEHRGIKTVRAT